MNQRRKLKNALWMLTGVVLATFQYSFAEEFSCTLNKAWEGMLSGSGSRIMAEPAVLPGRQSPPADRPALKRAVFNGRIKKIVLAGETAPEDLRGIITIEKEDGSVRSFLVSRYTFIMVVGLNGNGYAGELRQLKPGWDCRVAYDIPADDDWNTDLISQESEPVLKYADNMIVYYKR